MIRNIKFLEPMTANILSSHRKISPFGLAGGEAGKVGKNWVKRKEGTEERLNSTATVEMRAGDHFIIETPGSGGFGNSHLKT